jgi:hypothetical protein
VSIDLAPTRCAPELQLTRVVSMRGTRKLDQSRDTAAVS